MDSWVSGGIVRRRSLAGDLAVCSRRQTTFSILQADGGASGGAVRMRRLTRISAVCLCYNVPFPTMILNVIIYFQLVSRSPAAVYNIFFPSVHIRQWWISL